MANCGCTEDACNCILVGLGTVSTSQVGDTWFVTGTETPFTGQSTDQTIQITGGGTAGHNPDLEVNPDPDGGLEAQANGLGIKIDPNSTAPVTLTSDGLKVDCCGSLWSVSAQGFAPDVFLRLGEASGFVAANDGALPTEGAYNGGVTLGNIGAAIGDTNTSVDFDGTTAYVELPYDAGFNLWSNVTVHVAINPDTITGDDVIVDNLDLGLAGYRISLDNGFVTVEWGDGATTQFANTGVLIGASTGWTYVVLKLGPTSMRAYVDGALVASNLATTYIPQTAFNFYVGATDGSSNFFDGKIDEVVVWPIALTDAEILYLYQTISGIILNVQDTDTVDLTYNNLLLEADVRIDPASTATVTTSPAGLRIDQSVNSVTDTSTVNLTLTGAANFSADVIPNTSLGIQNTAGGVAANIQGTPAVIPVTAEDRIRFNASGEITYLPDGASSTAVAAAGPVTYTNQILGQIHDIVPSTIFVNTRPYAVVVALYAQMTGEYASSTGGVAAARALSVQYSIQNGAGTTGTQLAGTSSENHSFFQFGAVVWNQAGGVKVRFRSQLVNLWVLAPGQQAEAILRHTSLETAAGIANGAISSISTTGTYWVASPWRS